MSFNTSETEGEVRPVKLVEAAPHYFITDRTKAVVMLWSSVACFDVRISVTFHLIFVFIFQFGLGCCVATFLDKAAHSVDHIFSLYFEYL